MTTYNGERHVREQVESILSQTPAPAEIVIADDGSDDGTAGLLADLATAADTRVRIIGGDHVGLSANVARALRACTFPVVALADQDDVWLPGRVAAIEDAFADPATTLWFSDAELIGDEGEPLGLTLWDAVHLSPADQDGIAQGGGLRRLLHGMTVTGATMAVRRDVLEVALPLPAETEGPAHLYLHDGWLAVIAALLGRRRVDARRLTHYRQHEAQVTGMAVARSASATPSRGRASRRAIADEHARVHLVLERLRQRDALRLCAPTDAVALVEIDRLLGVRAADPGPGRAPAVLGAWRDGLYRRHARGSRTAIADLISLRR